jgi:alpha-1,2-mannosyltransferase
VVSIGASPRHADFRRTAPHSGPWTVALLGALPLCLLAVVFWGDLRWKSALGDFRIFRAAGSAVLAGRSPFVAPHAALLANHDKFVYPAPVAFLFSPFSLLPLDVARILFLSLSVLAVAAALWLLGVRDWRCYGVSFLLAPTFDDLLLGSMSSFLLLGLAVVWRFRDRAIPAAGALAVLILAKLMLWPLGVWLIATRRYRAAVGSMIAGCALVVGGWALIGFAGLREYPRLLRVLAQVEARDAYSLTGLLSAHGLDTVLVPLSLALAGGVGVVVAARGEGADRRGFTIAVAVALVASPIVWMHYLVVMLAPIALARPRLSALWFVPLVFWLTPSPYAHGSAWRTGLVLLAVGVITYASAVKPDSRSVLRPTFARRDTSTRSPFAETS